MKFLQYLIRIKELSWRKFVPSLVFLIILSILCYVIQSQFKGDGPDWYKCFRPGALALITGQNPHNLIGCQYMTWTLIPLIPLALLPPAVGMAILSSLAYFTMIWVARRMGANRFVLVALLLNPFFFLHYLLNPNVDWLAALGFVASPALGIPLLLTKPQLGAGLAIFLAVETFRKNGAWEMLKVFFPTILLFVISVAIYGPYFLNFTQLSNAKWSFLSMWPESILIGGALFVYALRKSHKGMAILSTPFLFPYVGFYTWPWALLGMLPSLWLESTVIAILSWMLWIWLTIRVNSGT